MPTVAYQVSLPATWALLKNGERKPSFQAGYELLGRYTILAEGVRGSLSELVMDKFDLRAAADPQHYGIGFKEVWGNRSVAT